MQRLSVLFVIAILAWTASASSAIAATASLRRGNVDATFYPGGYNGAADNDIFYYAPIPGTGHPAEPSVWMRSSDGTYGTVRGANGPSNIRTLFRYDLSGMSGQGVDVTGDATLTLTSAGGSPSAIYALFQIAAANAGWVESTNNVLNFPTNTDPSYQNKSNNGDPTWWYKSIDNATYAGTTGFHTTTEQDTTSIKWASGQASLGSPGSNPEGYANTGGLWNPIDLVDQNPATVASDYLTMGNMDPVASATFPILLGTASFTIPEAMVQSWIDDPSSNAGLLGKFLTTTSTTADFYSSEHGTTTRQPILTFDYEIAASTPGDFDNDGDVDGDDLAIWQAGYGLNANGDADGDGDSDGRDFLTWQRQFSTGPFTGLSAMISVPEPTSLVMALFAWVGVQRRRVVRKF